MFADIPGVRGAADGTAGVVSLNLTTAQRAGDGRTRQPVRQRQRLSAQDRAERRALSTLQLAWGTPALSSIAYAKPMLYGRVQNTVIQTYLP